MRNHIKFRSNKHNDLGRLLTDNRRIILVAIFLFRTKIVLAWMLLLAVYMPVKAEV